MIPEIPLNETPETNAGPEPGPATPETAAIPSTARPDRPRVVVLGGGVAGLTAAFELRRQLHDQAALTLISDRERLSLGLSLLWVPFGSAPDRFSFPLAPALQRRGIRFVCAYVEAVDVERRVVLAHGQEIPYDYLLIATGPRLDHQAIPGVGGTFNATQSLWPEPWAVAAGRALQPFLAAPGPAVVGIAPGARYLNAAYEFALRLDQALRRQGTRPQATITFVTPEPYLGHLDSAIPAARRVFAHLFAQRDITVVAGAAIARVDDGGVHLRDGRAVPAAYVLVMPALSGVTGLRSAVGLTDAHGFVPVDARFRHICDPHIYAAGVAAHLGAPASVASRLPPTSHLTIATARAAARNLAAALLGRPAVGPILPRALDLRIIDGGDAGVLLVQADLLRPWRLAVPLPGWLAHQSKVVLARYLLWKLRSGHTHWL